MSMMDVDLPPGNDAIISLVGKKQAMLTLDEDVLAALKARSNRTSRRRSRLADPD